MVIVFWRQLVRWGKCQAFRQQVNMLVHLKYAFYKSCSRSWGKRQTMGGLIEAFIAVFEAYWSSVRKLDLSFDIFLTEGK